MSSGYLVSNIAYPAVQYEPLGPEENGVYHEDREITLPSGPGSQMWRVYGATFNPTSTEWDFVGGVSTAYATVQNPDGSIHYLTYSGATTPGKPQSGPEAATMPFSTPSISA
jgi:hypothetical protein